LNKRFSLFSFSLSLVIDYDYEYLIFSPKDDEDVTIQPANICLFFGLCSIHVELSAQFKQSMKLESLLNRCCQY